jgi:hypothetical protein
MMGATLFTSLPPKATRLVSGLDFGPPYQRACIDSWIAAGFDVVSLNPESEIAELRKLEFPVSYRASPHPRPKILEYLAEARQSQTELTGIINADCLLINYPGFVKSILTGAATGLVMVERVNIDPNSLLPTGQTCLGFDAFFFNRTDAGQITIDPDLSVGQPWWDYWFPTEFAVSGIKLLRPQWPLIVHLDHEQGWSQSRWLEYGRRFITHFSAMSVPTNSSFSEDLREFVEPGWEEREDLGGTGDWSFNWLRDHADLLKAGQNDSSEALFGRILGAIANFDGMHTGTLALARAREELLELADLKAQLHLEVVDLKAQLHQIRQQRSAPKPFLIRLLRILLKPI